MPKVSIIIPTYNRSEFLDEAIQSALAQNYDNFDIIISDNNSSDDTYKVVSKYIDNKKIKYHKNKENIGMVLNWRFAVYELCDSEWFLLLSDDDYLIDNDYLKKATRIIKKHKSIVMIYAEGYILNQTTAEKTLLELPFHKISSGIDIFLSRGDIKPQDFTLCNVIFNRPLAIELNSFSNQNNLSCDSELFLSSSLKGEVGIIKGPVSVYRYHGNNLISTVFQKPEFAYNNLFYALTPYIIGKNILSENDLNYFVEKINLKFSIERTLLRVACFDWNKFLSYIENLNQITPELITFKESFKFKIKLYLCRYFGKLILLVKSI